MRQALGLAAAFVALSAAAAADWTAGLDRAVGAAVAAGRDATLSHIAVYVTALGSDPVVILAVVIAALYAASTGHRERIAGLITAPAGAFLTSTLAKLLLHHPRPTDAIIPEPASFGFPSGHAAAASACWLTLALVAAQPEPRRHVRRLLLGAAVAIALLVAWSRL